MPTPPLFNLFCNIWFNYIDAPVINFTTTPPQPETEWDVRSWCQLYVSSRANEGIGQSVDSGWPLVTIGTPWFVSIQLRLPAGTDISSPIPWPTTSHPGKTDYVEVPSDSGRFYAVTYVEDCHKGFPNEYRIAWLTQVWYNGDRPRT